jgi:carboxyl-terminal processing protease
VEGNVTAVGGLADRPTFQSLGGRTLFGGGGITPDVVVLPDTLSVPEQAAMRSLLRHAGVLALAIFDYATTYIGEHPDLSPDFVVGPAMLRDFRSFLEGRDVTVDDDVYRDGRRFLTYRLEREIALQAFGDQGAFERLQDRDAQLQRALELLRGADGPAALFQAADVPLPGDAPANRAAAAPPAESGGGA